MSFPKHSLASLGTIQTGSTPSTAEQSYWGGDTPFITPAELDQDAPVINTPRTLSNQGVQQSRLLGQDAVMVCCIGSLGKVGIAGRAVVTNQQINSIEFDQSKVFPKYGFYACRILKPTLMSMAPSTTIPIVSKSKFAQLEIPLPPLPEQRRIAAILDQAEALRAKRREALAQLDSLTHSIFIEMFGDAKTNPKQWPIHPFGTVCRNEDSRREPVKAADRARRTGIYPYYGASGVIDWLDDYLFDGERLLISEDGANLLARSSPIAFIAREKYWVNNHAHVIGPNGRANLRYLEFYLEAIDLTPYITGSAQPKLNQSNLDRLPVPLPPLALQDDFAKRLAAVEKVAALHQRAATASDGLIASLQHRAFAGELS